MGRHKANGYTNGSVKAAGNESWGWEVQTNNKNCTRDTVAQKGRCVKPQCVVAEKRQQTAPKQAARKCHRQVMHRQQRRWQA